MNGERAGRLRVRGRDELLTRGPATSSPSKAEQDLPRLGWDARLSTPALFAGLAGLKALIGTTTWLLVLATLSDGPAAAFGVSAAALQLIGLVGGAGLPVVVLRFSGTAWGPAVARVTMGAGAVGAAIVGLGLLAMDVPQVGTVEALLFVAACPLAALAVVVDATMAARGHWGAVGRRLAAAGLLRLALLGTGALSSSEVLVVLAAVLPEATSTAWLMVRHPEVTKAGQHARPARLGRYIATQYLSTMATFGSVLSLPVVAAASMPVGTRAVFFPAWAAVALAFSAIHAWASAKLIPTVEGRSVPPPVLANPALVASGALLTGAGLLWSVALGLDWTGWGDRPASVAGGAAMLVGATALWPFIATWMTELRRSGRNLATVTMVAPMLVAPIAIAGSGPALSIGTVAVAWGVALALCAASAPLIRPWLAR